MKQIINGSKYDTETAKEVGAWSNGCTYNDFHYCSETMYRKKNGEYFLFGDGGAMSKYAVPCGQNSWSGGQTIKPMSESEARKWAEEHLSADEYEEIFGEVEEWQEKSTMNSSVIMSKQEARLDIIKYLQAQEPEYFAKRSTTYFDVVGNEDVMQNLVEEYMRCVNRYGCDREWSCKDACDNDPGFCLDYD